MLGSKKFYSKRNLHKMTVWLVLRQLIPPALFSAKISFLESVVHQTNQQRKKNNSLITNFHTTTDPPRPPLPHCARLARTCSPTKQTNNYPQAGVSLQARRRERAGLLRVRDLAAEHDRARTGPTGTTRPRRHRGGGPVLLPRQRALPELPDRGFRRQDADLPDVLHPAVPQGAREAPRKEGSLEGTHEPGDAELCRTGAGRVAPWHPLPGGHLRAGDRTIQGVHAAVPRGAGETAVRPRVRRKRVEEQALDALQQEEVHGQGDALSLRRTF
ncbi:unnamed protein product [Ectocarpus sp. 12 AP-2014]